MQTQTINPEDLTWTELKNIVFAVSEQIKETSAQMKKNSSDWEETKAAIRKSSEKVDKQIRETAA